jgi:hypothetical protein
MAKEDKSAAILKNPSGTNIDILDLTDDRLDMPNLNKVVDQEVARLQREIIEDMKEVILADIKFDSIDYIPENDTVIQDTQIDYFRSEFNNVLELIYAELKKGNAENPYEVNMKEYLQLFSVEYDSSGMPVITFSLNIDTVDGADLSIDSDKINITKNSTRSING